MLRAGLDTGSAGFPDIPRFALPCVHGRLTVSYAPACDCVPLRSSVGRLASAGLKQRAAVHTTDASRSVSFHAAAAPNPTTTQR